MAEQRARITSWDENSSGPTDGTKTPRRYSSARSTTGGRENMLAFSFLFLEESHHSKTVWPGATDRSLRNAVWKDL